MARRRRLGKKFFKSLLPILLLLALAIVAVMTYVVHGVTRPPRAAYLVTPDTFRQISGPALKVSEQTWRNRDNTQARGWLLRGAPGSPGIILAHRYGVDRSWLFNLGVKINEATSASVLWPDLRGHGLNPPVAWTSFGGREADDMQAALAYLRGLKTADGQQLVGDKVGLYGIEMGAYASLRAATSETSVRALALDSVPRDPDEVMHQAVRNDLEINNRLLRFLCSVATRVYFVSGYDNRGSCDLARTLNDQKILLLSGPDAGVFRDSTVALAGCFPNSANLEIKSDLPLTGFRLPSATGEQGEAYDRLVIDFFDRNLR